MRRHAVAGLGLLALAGCPGGGARPVVAPDVSVREEPDAESESPAAELAGAVLETYSHLSLGNLGAYFEGLASDQAIALFGVTADNVVVGRRPAAAQRDRRLYRYLGPTILSKNLDVHVSADGSVGWVYDELSYRVPFMGRQASIPIRQTSVLVRDFDRWVEVVEHWSYAYPVDDLIRRAAAGQAIAPRRFSSSARGPTARTLLRLVGKLHNDPLDGRGDLILGRADALVLLPGDDSEYRGGAAATAPALASLFGPGATVGLRDYRVAVGPSGAIAWVVANLAVRTTHNDDAVEVGLRGTYVFEKVGGAWHAIQVHVSAPISQSELGERIFGSP